MKFKKKLLQTFKENYVVLEAGGSTKISAKPLHQKFGFPL